jgi:hypothetical protein
MGQRKMDYLPRWEDHNVVVSCIMDGKESLCDTSMQQDAEI